MKLIRARLLVIGLFSLISLGQAYPFSLAWGIPKTQHSCCCSGVTKPCDCHHEKKKMSCHKEKRVGYSQLPCGGKTDAQVLSFQTDPFIPSKAISARRLIGVQPLAFSKIFFQSVFILPEAPPPKVS